MPRYYRRRTTRVVKPKKKWATNIKRFDAAINENPPYTYLGYEGILCQNATQSSLPTPVVVKTGNFKVQADFIVETPADGNTTGTLYAYIMYLPEGASPTGTGQGGAVTAQDMYDFINKMVTAHPEWIMGWKQIGFDWLAANQHVNFDKVQFSSRLKRNLNSGDKVSLLIMSTAILQSFHMSAMCQFWTCAN